jgi:hypothetical protein
LRDEITKIRGKIQDICSVYGKGYIPERIGYFEGSLSTLIVAMYSEIEDLKRIEKL